jgi:hypothetical protein
MKDSKGHGSDPRGSHSAGVNEIGRGVSAKAVDVIAKNAQTGFSVRHDTGEMPSRGYQVAVEGRTEQEPLNLKDVAGAVAAHVAKNSDLYANPRMYIGGWNSPYTGKVHLEPSQNIGTRLRAIREGTARNQVSIWDNKRGRDIKTGGTGRS